MGRAVGIDLGTTNSEVAIVENGQARVLPAEDGDLILPSCVGLSESGKLVVGREALRQFAAAPERTIKSIKRKMGTAEKTKLGDREYLPQEISAIILRALKQRAEAALGEEVTQAVITVPAYFTDAQRQATKDAGEIAGLEVLQIINEPTAASLAYDVRADHTERLLVYDLGGGTFDVSIVEITGEVTEVLASHGNNHLGGDDFDRRLQLHLEELFRKQHGVPVPDDLLIRARLIRAAEQAKIQLSEHAFATVREAFLATKGKTALHLETEISRKDLESLIEPMLAETLEAIDRTLEDAHLKVEDIDRVVLVGGSTRMPLVQKLVEAHLGKAPSDGIQPELCVALGAAVQAGVLTDEAVEAILVDVTPHSLGIEVVLDTPMGTVPGMLSILIPRNTVIPVSRSEVYQTLYDNQTVVKIPVYQGDNPIARENVPLGELEITGLPERPAGETDVEVHFDFDTNGILTVTATEKGKGQQKSLVVSNTDHAKMSSHELQKARTDLNTLFANMIEALAEEAEQEDELAGDGNSMDGDPIDVDSEVADSTDSGATATLERASQALTQLAGEQANELRELLGKLEAAIAAGDRTAQSELVAEIEDMLYYAEQAESP